VERLSIALTRTSAFVEIFSLPLSGQNKSYIEYLATHLPLSVLTGNVGLNSRRSVKKYSPNIESGWHKKRLSVNVDLNKAEGAQEKAEGQRELKLDRAKRQQRLREPDLRTTCT
jgi:hypothetical protein